MLQNQARILLIEDNSELSNLYKLKLEHEGFKVNVATDGEQGLLMAAEDRPDLILLDILMPNMNGFEVLQAIKNNTSLNSAIIVISNLSGPDELSKAKTLGADDYMIKSDVTPALVAEKVKALLHIS